MARPLGTVVALGTAQTLAWASTYYLPAILAVPMAREIGVAPATVYAAFSLALVVSAAIGPLAGRRIDQWGGRPVLVGTSLVFAAGLLALSQVQGPLSLFAAWALIGLGMGAGLYEAAFAALVRLQGTGARNAITGITLIAGFASTVGWPLSTLLEAQFGWRAACVGWAALHLLLGLPLNASLPRVDPAGPSADPSAAAAPPPGVEASAGPPGETLAEASPEATVPPRGTAVALALVFAITWFISTAMAAHLPRLLQLGGATLAVAVAAGALVGPAQVAGRLLEFGLLRRVHPLLSARLAAVAHPLGAVALALLGAPAAAAFALLHGAGNGILTIAKGTLPLVLFGPGGYGQRQGLLMAPARLGQALSPWLFGLWLDRYGAGALWISAALGTVAGLILLRVRATAAPASAVQGLHRG